MRLKPWIIIIMEILCCHNGAYNDPRYAVVCDLQFSYAYLTHSTSSLAITVFILLLKPTLTPCFYLAPTLNGSILFVFLWHCNIMLAYYFMAMTAFCCSSYFDSPILASAAYLINNEQPFVLFSSASSVGGYAYPRLPFTAKCVINGWHHIQS